MKLKELKTITESNIPIHMSMTLQQVIDDGKITNNVQNYIIANLVNIYKHGGQTSLLGDLFSYSGFAGSALIDEIKSLSDAKVVDLAKILLFCLKERDVPTASNCSLIQWINYVKHKQD